jgi:ELWxxDGT repeat protein
MKLLSLILICLLSLLAEIKAQFPLLVKDVNPNGGSFTDQAFEIGDTTYLVINDSIVGNELWITNFKNGTTSIVKDINMGSNGSDPIIIGTTNHKLIFWAVDTTGKRNLWCSDGSPIGTFKLNDISTSAVNNKDYCQTDSLVFFVPDNSVYGKEIWVTDGSILGTKLLKDIYPGTTGCNPLYLTKFGNKMLFSADDGFYGQEPWITDGSEMNTSMVKDISPWGDSYPNSFIVTGNYFYFASAIGLTSKVYRSYGTDSSTVELGSIPMYVSNMFSFKNNLYATGNIWYMLPYNNHSPCIAEFDLSTNTGSIIKDFGNLDFTNITYRAELVGDSVFYFGYSQPSGGAWYRCDGTDVGTIDIGVPDGYLYSYATVLYKDMLCFMHEESANGNVELFILDGLHFTNTMLDILQGQTSSYPHKITVFKDKVYFIAKDSIMGNQLFVTEGDVSNTFVLLADNNCNYDALPADGTWRLPHTDHHLFFNANYHNIGQELYSLDGSIPLNTESINPKKDWVFYPNPSDGNFKYSGNILPIQIDVFNSIGELVLTSQTLAFDLSPFENGVYFAKVQTKYGVTTNKILLNK